MNPIGSEWVDGYLKKASTALGLNAWAISITWDTNPHPDTGADACCNASVEYLQADIKMRPELVATETMAAKVLIVHELLHVACVYTEQAVEHQVNLLLKSRQRQNAIHAFYQWHEHTITRLSRQLAPLIDAWDGVDRWWTGETDDDSTGESEPVRATA